MILLFLLLINVSQCSLALVEVNEGKETVLLSCQYSGFIPGENPTVMWNRTDIIHPKTVHLQREKEDELGGQNWRYTGRTSMRPDALDTGDFSLTLREPKVTDTGKYTCSLSNGRKELKISDIHLKVKVYRVEVNSGVESVQLPCNSRDLLTKNGKVEWVNNADNKVHVYQNSSDQPQEQHQFYRDRTKMKRNPLKSGDLSVNLTYPSKRDEGMYTCNVYSREGYILLKKQVELKVRVPQVQVESGVDSVQLPCSSLVPLPEDANIEWRNADNRKVHVYENGSDQHVEQHQEYRDRTKMNKDLLKTGDLSLTLKYPTERDTNTYTCTVYSREGNIRLKKQVELKVREWTMSAWPIIGIFVGLIVFVCLLCCFRDSCRCC